jgi:hypothetical protein
MCVPLQAVNILETFFDVEDGEVENLAPGVDANHGTYHFGGPRGPVDPAAQGAPQIPPGAQNGGFNFGAPMA